MEAASRPVAALLKTVRENPESVGVWTSRHRARPRRVPRLGGYCNGASKTHPPGVDSRSDWRAPPAPDTSSRHERRSRRRARVVAPFREAVPPEPTGATPNSRSDQSAAPDRPGCSRNVAPVPEAASPAPAPSLVRKNASNDPAPERRLHSCPRRRLPPCLASAAPEQRCVCIRRSPDIDPDPSIQR
jgi:hypothetical protein